MYTCDIHSHDLQFDPYVLTSRLPSTVPSKLFEVGQSCTLAFITYGYLINCTRFSRQVE